MTLDELLDELNADDIENGEVEVRAVFQPAYPLVAEIVAVRWHNDKPYLILGEGYDYYQGEDQDEVESETVG